MLNLNITADLEKRFIPFLKKGSKIKIVIDPFSSPSGTNFQIAGAQVQIDMKENLSPDMVEAMGEVMITLHFGSATSSEIVSEEETSQRRPALPYVESEYDEVRDVIDTDLGSPVQTLYSMGKQTPNRQPVQAQQKKKFVVPDPEPIPEKKFATVAAGPDQMQTMMKQMQAMMAKMQTMQSGKPIPADETQEEEEENFDTIMDAQEFYEALSAAGNDLPDIDFNKKLTKEEAVQLEKYKINKPAYVVSTKGILFIDDVGISVQQSLACNISSIPIFRLKKSSDLIRCLKNGMLKFVNYKTAKKLSERCDLTSATEGIGGKLKTYFGEHGSGVDLALDFPIDITPGFSDEDSTSERMLQRASGRRRTEGIIVDDVDEMDDFVTNENMPDEQSNLINLAGGGMDSEEASEALLASARDRSRPVSKTWKPVRNLDE